MAKIVKTESVPYLVQKSFECKVEARVAASVDKEAGRLKLCLWLGVRDSKGKSIHAPSGHPAETPFHVMYMPLNLFRSDEAIGEFVRRILDRFAAYGPLLLAEQGAVHLNGAAQLQKVALTPSRHDDVDGEMLIGEHLRDTENVLRLIYGTPSAEKKNGRPRQWTKEELTFEIARAFRQLKRPMEWNYEGVAAKLKEWYPGRAPASGAALFQQVRDLGINWKELKRSGQRNIGQREMFPIKQKYREL